MRLFRLDDTVKIKIGYKISRIEKLLRDVNPLLDLCKVKYPDIIEIYRNDSGGSGITFILQWN